MWDQYRKTFRGIQIVIALITCAVFVGMQHQWFVAAVFFLMMQVGAIAGAVWATRLKRKLQPPAWR